MQLKNFIKEQKKKHAACALEIGINLGTLRKYLDKSRNPETPCMRKLFLWSKGVVEPNDFYPMDEWRKELEADNQN